MKKVARPPEMLALVRLIRQVFADVVDSEEEDRVDPQGDCMVGTKDNNRYFWVAAPANEKQRQQFELCRSETFWKIFFVGGGRAPTIPWPCVPQYELKDLTYGSLHFAERWLIQLKALQQIEDAQ